MTEPAARPPLQPIQSTGGLDLTDPGVQAQLQTLLDGIKGKTPAQPAAKGSAAHSSNKPNSNRNSSWTTEEEEALYDFVLADVKRKRNNAASRGQHSQKQGNMQTGGVRYSCCSNSLFLHLVTNVLLVFDTLFCSCSPSIRAWQTVSIAGSTIRILSSIQLCALPQKWVRKCVP